MMYYYLYMGNYSGYEDFMADISGGLFPDMAIICEEFIREEFGLGDWKLR